MLRIGHIDYSNCIPVHAALLHDRPPGIEVVHGTPAELNRALAAGEIDVAPCSSIEFALHAEEYRLLPGLVIGSNGPVKSILLEISTDFANLSGAPVAVPTASATSVVLLRILLQIRFGVQPRFEWFDQEAEDDPITAGAAAALRIGDLALRRTPPAGRAVFDLGSLWTDWTGLPFAFALWQTRLQADRDAELRRLVTLLCAWRQRSGLDALASLHAARIGISPEHLTEYWQGLQFDLDAPMQRGLMRFFELAAQLGEIARVPTLRWVE